MAQINSDINISITFRHTDSTEALKKYASEKVSQCVSKYSSDSTEVRVILSVTKLDHCAEIYLHSKRFEISAKAVTGDLYSSIDKVIDNMDSQLRKQKEKTTQHKQASVAA